MYVFLCSLDFGGYFKCTWNSSLSIKSTCNYFMSLYDFCCSSQDDWQKEKRDFLQSITRLSSLPRTSSVPLNTGETFQRQNPTLASQISVGKTNNNMDIVPIANIPILERKASVYADVVKHLNNSREHGIQFKVSSGFFIAFL